ncbi:MAG: transcription termination/antitermination protein NusA [Anaerolineales bacterium]|nr:transcription termination/antitermination protein NusA [Anaerolineales bacterium]
MKKEFRLAFNEVLDEKQLPKEIILEAIEAAMVSAYRKTVNASNAQHIQAKIDAETGEALIYAEKEVVEDVQDSRTEVSLEDAIIDYPDTELGAIVIVESTPRDFGRVAAQTARQVIQQRIREAERKAQFDHFNAQKGEIINGIVQAVKPQEITLGLDRRAEGLMPRNQQIPGERFRVHDRVRALLMDVKETPRGPQIVLSRSHRNFMRRLLEDEVPEIYNGMVEIRSIAREPGYRSKVAVSALQPGIDPVGACVGVRGVRIQAIVRELNDEKIDVIEWSNDPVVYIAKALSPARVTGVYLDEKTPGTKTATVVVPEDQLSLAIGRDGQNARLAAKLTSWRIDIKSLMEATSDSLSKLSGNGAYAKQAEELKGEVPQVENILIKKAEGRTVTPEEYTFLGRFVDHVERGASQRRAKELAAEQEKIAKIQATIPNAAFDIPLDDLDLSPRLNILLTGEGFSTIGDLMVQLATNPDDVLALNGVGPKAMTDIEQKIAEYQFPVEKTKEIVSEEPAVERSTDEATALLQEIGEEAETVDTEEVLAEVFQTEAEDSEEESGEEFEEDEEADDLTSEETFRKAVEDLDRPSLKFIDDEPSIDDLLQKKKPAKKKRQYREIEYDPDNDTTIVRHRRKRGEDDVDGWDY